VLHELEERGIVARPASIAPDGIELESAVDVASLPGYVAGRFTLQGEASQLIPLLLSAMPGHSVLDVCAAPGGKTTQLAQLVGEEGRVLAVDRRPGGVAQVRRNAVRLGLSRVSAVAADSRVLPLRESATFDAILVDAPCSGFGTLRQHPEIRWRRTARNVMELATLQSKLLQAVAGHVKPGGVLVYATCTVGRQENEDVLAGFLARQGDFRVEPAPEGLPEAMRRLFDPNGFLRTSPHRDGLDGFFAGRLRRRS
jgi:16S rRNA (cytosine967-C5)-methyltransferase